MRPAFLLLSTTVNCFLGLNIRMQSSMLRSPALRAAVHPTLRPVAVCRDVSVCAAQDFQGTVVSTKMQKTVVVGTSCKTHSTHFRGS